MTGIMIPPPCASGLPCGKMKQGRLRTAFRTPRRSIRAGAVPQAGRAASPFPPRACPSRTRSAVWRVAEAERARLPAPCSEPACSEQACSEPACSQAEWAQAEWAAQRKREDQAARSASAALPKGAAPSRSSVPGGKSRHGGLPRAAVAKTAAAKIAAGPEPQAARAAGQKAVESAGAAAEAVPEPRAWLAREPARALPDIPSFSHPARNQPRTGPRQRPLLARSPQPLASPAGPWGAAQEARSAPTGPPDVAEPAGARPAVQPGWVEGR